MLKKIRKKNRVFRRKNMKKKISSENGVTMMTLTLTIIVMIVILSVITFYVRNSVNVERFQNMKADIEEIESKVLAYYLENKVLPVYSGETDSRKVKSEMKGDSQFFNPNDGNDYAKVNLDLIGVVNSYDTTYYVNTESLTVYAIDTVSINFKNYPRPADEFDKISFKTDKIPDWQEECNNADPEMFTYEGSVITGINFDYFRKINKDPYNHTDIIVPTQKKDGSPITGIADGAFSSPVSVSNTLKIPNNIDNVGKNLLGSNSNLKFIYVNSKIIDKDAFRGCHNIQAVWLGPSSQLPDATTDTEGLFYGKTNLRQAYIDSNNLGKYLFAGCQNLQEVQLNQEIEVIPEGCFKDCTNGLTKLNIWPTSLVSIEKDAFNNTSISSLIMPDNLERIGEGAFKNCKKLNTLEFNNLISKVSKESFYGCYSLKTLILGENVTVIEESAFRNSMNGINKIICNNNLKRIEKEAFADCNALQNGTIDFNVGLEYIGNRAFANTNLRVRETEIPIGCELDAYTGLQLIR